MIRSLLRYTNYFTQTTLARPERRLLQRNAALSFSGALPRTKEYSKEEKIQALHAAAAWLWTNQRYGTDKGFSTYYIVEGHTSSYPETTGYIIDSLLEYVDRYPSSEAFQLLKDSADWLLSIQKPSGGWAAGYVAQNRPEVVFNTGQILRGLMHLYHKTQDRRYLEACHKACQWLAAIQEADGSWQHMASMNAKRVYDSYVAAPMLEVYKVTADAATWEAAIRNFNWIVQTQQEPNGWFNNCDNTQKHNDRPILHTIAYTIDGLLDAGLFLKDTNYLQAAEKAAKILKDLFLQQGYLNGRYNRRWEGSEAMICTGCAQMSIIWMKLYGWNGDKSYFEAAKRLNNQLVRIQSLTLDGSDKIKGALQGSFPLWGRYEPFAFPNWATKYLLDALLMEIQLRE